MPNRRRFVALDGLRGVAAVGVLLYHIDLFVKQTPLFQHGYLGVDFFFMLSGFVIAAAYEDQWITNRLGLIRFMAVVRAIRLYPLLLLGAILGVFLSFLHPAHTGMGVKRLVEQVLFIPAVNSGRLYPLNNTQWSLGFELIANLMHYLVLRRLGRLQLASLTVVFAVALVVLTSNYGTLNVGHEIATLPGGLARVGFSYTAGLLIYRLYRGGYFDKMVGIEWIGAVMLIVTFCIPNDEHSRLGRFLDLASVFLVFPTVVCLSLAPIRNALLNRASEESGRLSYPMYMLQLPFFELAKARLVEANELTRGLASLAIVGCIIALSRVALRYYDEPARKHLNRFFSVSERMPAVMAP